MPKKLIDLVKAFIASLPLGSEGYKVVTKDKEIEIKKIIETYDVKEKNK